MAALVEPQLFVTAKPGEHPRSCQDVGWFLPAIGDHASHGQGISTAAFAVADGATGGWDGQRWAELAVEATAGAIVESGGRLDDRWVRSAFADHLDKARARWVKENSGSVDNDPVRAMARTKFLAIGGHCTLTAGIITPTTDGHWVARGFTIGDSPLFQLRGTAGQHQLVASIPLERSQQFDANPNLLSSRPAGPGTIAAGLRSFELQVAPGDCLLVMTDALAQWALRRHEAGQVPWAVLAGLDHDGFMAMVARAREAGEIVSDDILMLRLVAAEYPFRTMPAVASQPTPVADPNPQVVAR